MFKNKLFFCFGDYRDRKRKYRIFLVDTVEKAHKVAEALGYKVLVDETYKCEGIRDMEERIAESILSAIHIKLHGVENTVSCVRRNKNDTEQLKRHFMTSDIRKYFPKLLEQPVNRGTLAHPLMFHRRDYPWMNDYIIREMLASGHGIPNLFSVRIVDKPNKAVFEQGEPMVFDKD